MMVGILWKRGVNFFIRNVHTAGAQYEWIRLGRRIEKPRAKDTSHGTLLTIYTAKGEHHQLMQSRLALLAIRTLVSPVWYFVPAAFQNDITSTLAKHRKAFEGTFWLALEIKGELISPNALPLNMQRSHQTPFPQLHPPYQGLSPLVDTLLQVIGLLPA